ncbi:hypothetical protein ANCCEY_04679 [Ancylostoma ceylanicum]|uniref:RecA family profile 1 domain-containing protein n=1 Tax=Ancylostoma ceylanicum TaxID=53326 RepID=A0A0D6M1G9_9BILA|nr:hypothetical protein ANCCEY_04679 [Ancylostoma ceylanicum]
MDNKRVESWGNCAASFAHFVAQVSLELSLKLVLKQMHVQRLEVLNGFQNSMGEKSTVQFKTARELHEFECSSSSALPSGCPALDDLIGGGFLPGCVAEISGEAGCGKSQICMQFAAVTIANGHKVVCVETERGFSVKRVRQILEHHTDDVDVAMQRLLMSSPSTLEQLVHVLSKLETSAEPLADTSVLIVDAVATFFRGCSSKEDFKKWRDVLSIVGNIAVHHNIAVICVNHVTSRQDTTSGEWSTSPFLSKECVGAVARLCKKRCGLRITKDGMCFVANDTLREQGNFLSVLIPPRPDFEVYNFAGVSEEMNEIVMELDIDDFEKSVTGVHSYLKIKLRQKPNQTLKVSNGGEMHLRCRMDQAEVTVYFSELANDTITGQLAQGEVHLLIDVVSDRFAEFILRRDGLEVSFLVGGVNDVY